MKEHVLNVSGEGYVGFRAPEFTAAQHIYFKRKHSSTIHLIFLVSIFRALLTLVLRRNHWVEWKANSGTVKCIEISKNVTWNKIVIYLYLRLRCCLFICVLFVQRMISILWKILIILHGNSCMSKELDCGGISFEKKQVLKVIWSARKSKLVLILRNSGHELYSFWCMNWSYI